MLILLAIISEGNVSYRLPHAMDVLHSPFGDTNTLTSANMDN